MKIKVAIMRTVEIDVDSSAPETIFNVCDMEGNTILQW